MMTANEPFADVPLDRRCAVSVVIPAHDEAGHIARTLAALVGQRACDSSPLAPASYEVLVYANNCSDATADVVRAFAARHPGHAIHVAEAWLPANVAHIGTARHTAMRAAAARYRAAGRDGVLAATDADTIPAPGWLAWTLREMRTADVVLGRILVDRAEWAALPAHTRRMLRDEEMHLFVVAQLESLLDPERYGPWPRHWQRSGPSFAVSVAAHDRAGGVPLVRVLEDVAFYDALVRSGARIRHSLRVRVSTSARLDSRAPGGFGSRVAAWNQSGAGGALLLVEDPAVTLARLVQPGEPLACDRVPVAEAIATLRQLIAAGPVALRATRSNVASIAG
jgi:hypothetical protein